MKIKIDLADNFIDVWNEEKEIWERYVKIGLEEEKKIPEKITVQDLLDLDTGSLLKRIVDNQNQLIDYLKSKGDE